ncbi:undecaprenyldiphospho-muramoylpentapeptide beta-N-acetylglucosaminyltransferase [Aestuariibacter halophilus]|uniref:UDP-N-acetylglucosamine--N-acetylmuramyl-(pentapeptide) pyrophosphoryl-undecaprenol N-acetylglucosamine transferase n=1 Tax=Fluctibacter halophilus TaxID=226011 RepID=A0ABS8G779_9ALTE|nr:undecaprenyldiphospho-muramoylpentapeptide beta-N-acetylglucosaminyltransferase [Aestuariibacter halophilus]MCC2616452.1 undecaprenyldiphospho-muramoylpentapeptide beta-N-acetylglucosaminyltransferase [Aestuariibacter halophilus]
MTKRLLVMAGGTGGHVFPGLAVADCLKAQGWQVDWLGTPARMEATLVPQHGYPFHGIDVAGLRGNGALGWLKAPLMLLRAIRQSRRIIKQLKPDVVLGMGGFASGPGGVAAKASGIPLVLHEQNAAAGLTNKLLAPLASRVLCGFAGAFTQATVVGNPVRQGFTELTPKHSVNTPMRLLVIGGSLGAQALNDAVPTALAQMQNIEVRHQAGKGNAEHVTERYRTLGNEALQWQVDAFIDDMVAAYAWADIVVCRAGALTVSELAASGRAGIFVPLPHAVDDHQTRNAKALTDHQAGILLPQSAQLSQQLTAVLNNLIANPEDVITMGNKARALATLDAANSVARICSELAENKHD